MSIVPDEHCEMQYIYDGPIGNGSGMWTVAWHTGGVTPSTLDEGLVDAVAPLVTGQLSAGLFLTSIRLVFGTATPSEPIVRDIPAGVFGVANSGIPFNSAYLVQKRTVQGGRRNRGRLFLPGVVDSAIGDNGVLTPSAQEDLQDAVDLWITETEAAWVAEGATEVYPCILHADGVGAPPVVEQFSVSGKIGTQRRRLVP